MSNMLIMRKKVPVGRICTAMNSLRFHAVFDGVYTFIRRVRDFIGFLVFHDS